MDGWTRGFGSCLSCRFPAVFPGGSAWGMRRRRCQQAGKQLFLGGLTSGDPAVMPRVLRFANRLMWQWGCRSGQLESAANALTLEEEKRSETEKVRPMQGGRMPDRMGTRRRKH